MTKKFYFKKDKRFGLELFLIRMRVLIGVSLLLCLGIVNGMMFSLRGLRGDDATHYNNNKRAAMTVEQARIFEALDQLEAKRAEGKGKREMDNGECRPTKHSIATFKSELPMYSAWAPDEPGAVLYNNTIFFWTHTEGRHEMVHFQTWRGSMYTTWELDPQTGMGHEWHKVYFREGSFNTPPSNVSIEQNPLFWYQNTTLWAGQHNPRFGPFTGCLRQDGDPTYAHDNYDTVVVDFARNGGIDFYSSRNPAYGTPGTAQIIEQSWRPANGPANTIHNWLHLFNDDGDAVLTFHAIYDCLTVQYYNNNGKLKCYPCNQRDLPRNRRNAIPQDECDALINANRPPM